MIGERPPTAGLRPSWRDVLAGFVGDNDLEAAIAARLGLPQVQLECSGTAALFLAFSYLRTQSPARTVIVPAYTCPLVVAAATLAHLRVMACDTQPDRLDMDVDHLRSLLGEDVLCIVPTHYGGALTDVKAVSAVVAEARQRIFVVEDAAQAFGATWDGAPAGLAGDIGIYSFAAGKGLTLFEGGCLVTRDADIRAGVHALRASLIKPNIVWEWRRSLELLGYTALYNSIGLQLAYSVPLRRALARGDIEKAIGDEVPSRIPLHDVGCWRRAYGVSAMRRLDNHLSVTQSIFARANERLVQMPGVTCYQQHPAARPTGTFAFGLCADNAQRDAILAKEWTAGTGISILFARAITDYPHLPPCLTPTEIPNAHRLIARLFTISTTEINTIKPALNNFFSKYINI